MDRRAGSAYCGFLVIHGVSVLLMPRVVAPGWLMVGWILFPLLISLTMLGAAASGRLHPGGPLALIAGADSLSRFLLGLTGALLWLKVVPSIGILSILLGVVGWALTEHRYGKHTDEWTRVDAIFRALRSTSNPRQSARIATAGPESEWIDVVVSGPSGALWRGSIKIAEISWQLCRVRLVCEGRELTGEAPDYFAALCSVREQLAVEGHTPRCNGAARNVFPSGMAREMGGGLQAYRLRLGQPARTADLVNIFEWDPDLELASVGEQRLFYESWLASLRGIDQVRSRHQE